MTCKLEPSEKQSRAYLRAIRSIINTMLTKRVYPNDMNFKNGLAEYYIDPFGEREFIPTGDQTISFTYHRPTLKKAKRKNK